MIFKKIEMVGFKSFADRTVIEFDNNFTAIVGPNGCGKSNVSDAIRWVLGEQSAKMLRGDSMQDVIFNGTEKRHSLSYCEVTLTFDNSTRFFNFDYDELAITRKLYRSGQSDYLINRNPCHLKDIVNLLFNSGLGKNGYSVISQGKVTEIVDSKPENRRAMFEDAAGVSKYKADKLDAERKLERTEDNLTRLGDILAELERQMGPLKKQAENAKKYLEYKGQLKDLEVNAYIYQYENANATKEKINIKLKGIEEQLALRNQDLSKASGEYDEAMDSLNNFDKVLASIHDKILELTVGLEKQEGETRLAREKINFTHKDNDRLHLDLSNSKTALENAEEIKQEKISLLENLNSDLEALEKSFDELGNTYSALASEVSINENQAGLSQQKIIETLGSLSDIKSSLSRLLAEKELLTNSLSNLEKDIEILSARKQELGKQYEDSCKILDEKNKKFEQAKAQCEDLSSKNYINENKLRSLENEKANLITQIKVYENRKKLLTELQAEYEGYSFAVKKLLKESEKSDILRKQIVGVTASLIHVPQKFETAIEIALGGAVQNIITYDEDGAKALINYLKTNGYGRATFLPISSMKRRDIDERLFAGKQGVYGVASKLVDYDKKIDNVVSNLLGSTVVVENLGIAVSLAKSSSYAFRIVTLEGDVVNPQGSLTGGSKKAESSNLMGREREIQNLAIDIEKLNSRLAGIDKELQGLSSSFAGDKSKLTQLINEQNAISVDLAQEKEKQGSINKTLAEVSDNLSVNQMEAESVKNRLGLIEGDLARSQKLESALSGNQKDADELAKEQKAKFEQLRLQRDQINENLSAVKVEIASTKARIGAVKDEILRLEDEIGRQNALIADTEDKIAKNDQFIADAEEMIKVQLASAPSSAKKDELDKLNSRKGQIESQKSSLSAKIKDLDNTKTGLMDEISKITDRKYKEEMELSKVDTELEQMQERIFEEYSLTYVGCLDLRRPDFDINVGMPEINKLKREISALGYVNVNAIEDCKALLDRYEDLSSQRDDLKKAEDDLNKIIKDLSDIMIEKFNNELDRINESFKITFRELFGGGTAKLALSDESNPLDSGVEIFAQPPGKKIQNMTLLSGGEKSLTAMAVIFAILRVKPLPFCLFDEVEAALDDSNVEIVDKYLKKLCNETQFILITHKKPTMEYAEALFGVTMEEKGVSKIVSVKLADAIKHAQEN